MDLLLAPVFVTGAMLFAVFMVSPLLLAIWLFDKIKNRRAKDTMLDEFKRQSDTRS